jgi:hypothetical protein
MFSRMSWIGEKVSKALVGKINLYETGQSESGLSHVA